MKSKYWLLYILFYLLFSMWAIFKLRELNQPHTINAADIFSLVMLVSILGLAFKKKIISNALWKWISLFGFFSFIHLWLILPMMYIEDGYEWKTIGIIQLYAVPHLPLFYGLFLYAWRSPGIWNKTPNKAIKTDG